MTCQTFGRTHRSTCRSSNSIFETREWESKFERCDGATNWRVRKKHQSPSCFPNQLFAHIGERKRATFEQPRRVRRLVGRPRSADAPFVPQASNFLICESQSFSSHDLSHGLSRARGASILLSFYTPAIFEPGRGRGQSSTSSNSHDM